MPNVKAMTLVLALSAALLVSGLSRSATAQEAYDPEDTVYATGAIFETEDELADKPRTPLFRAYLPPSVDLRDRFSPSRRSRRARLMRGLGGRLRSPLILQQPSWRRVALDCGRDTQSSLYL